MPTQKESIIAKAIQDFVTNEDPDIIGKLKSGENIFIFGKPFTREEMESAFTKIGNVCKQSMTEHETLINNEVESRLQTHVLENMPIEKFHKNCV